MITLFIILGIIYIIASFTGFVFRLGFGLLKIAFWCVGAMLTFVFAYLVPGLAIAFVILALISIFSGRRRA